MPSQRPVRNPVGILKKVDGGSDWKIPIYGVDTMEFARETIWNLQSTIVAPVIATWSGDKPVEFNFKFTLVAGVGVPSREKLFEYVRIAHALGAANYVANGKPDPPPACIFILGSYVASKGLLLSIRVTVDPPWGTGSTTADGETVESSLATKATFTGTFLPLPGWDGSGKQIVAMDIARFSRDDIKDSFYKHAP